MKKEPEQLELDVDIPIITQDNAPVEILLSISEDELKPESKERMERFYSLPVDFQSVIRKNSSINIEGQIKIVEEIENNIAAYTPLLSWTQIPTFEQLA